jgi:hypothetical protein
MSETNTIALDDVFKRITPLPHLVKCVKTSIGRCFKIGSKERVEHPHGGVCAYEDETSLNPNRAGEVEATAIYYAHAANVLPELVDIIHSMEWAPDDYCPRCRNHRHSGHLSDCPVLIALARAEKIAI